MGRDVCETRVEWFDSFNCRTQKRSTSELIARNSPVSRPEQRSPIRHLSRLTTSRRAIERVGRERSGKVPSVSLNEDALVPNLKLLKSAASVVD